MKELNLAFERIQLRSQLERLGRQTTSMRFPGPTPDVLTRPIRQGPATRIDATPSATVPALVVWVAGLALIIAAAVILYRRRARPLRV